MTEKVCPYQEPMNEDYSTCLWFLEHKCNNGKNGPVCPLGNVVLAPEPFHLNAKFN